MVPARAICVALFIACLTNVATGVDKYTDGNRPYEFGFTIDGEQHRHEKKDENGIIMGEFGFITADGVYHVTVYATDEQGRFKILSMKNIRVKPYPTAANQNARTGHSLSLTNLPKESDDTKKSNKTPDIAPPQSRTTQNLSNQNLNPAVDNPNTQNKQIAPLGPRPPASPAKSCSHCSLPTTTTLAPTKIESEQYNSNDQSSNYNVGYQNTPISREEENNYASSQQGGHTTSSDRLEKSINREISLPKELEPPIPSNEDVSTNKQIFENTGSVKQVINKHSEEQSIPNTYSTNTYSQAPNTPFNNAQNTLSSQQGTAINTPLSHQELEQISENNSKDAENQSRDQNSDSDQGQNGYKNNPQLFSNQPGNVEDDTAIGKAPVGFQPQKHGLSDVTPNHDKEIVTENRNNYADNESKAGEREANEPAKITSGERNAKAYEPNFEPQNALLRTNLNVFNTTQEAPKTPELISAQMQIVDRDTDIYHKSPGESDGLPEGVTKDFMMRVLYVFNYTVGFHGHYEKGFADGSKQGYYYVTGRNGVRTRVDYEADEKGFRPKISQDVLDLLSDDVPKPETEKEPKYGLKSYEFKWFYFPVGDKERR
ncbi:unnamed protein product [Leptosia nina]|uniref:Uncharacterized protein n=1 Tax=Leptosia nina TaxID=320188 RepID=A0AAV1JYX7_9NEOP